MAKQIVAWCDVCMEKDEHVSAGSFQVGLDGATPVEVDLCETHEKALITPLRELLAVGQPIVQAKPAVKSGGKKIKPFKCALCQQGITSRDSLGKHLRTRHEVSMRDIDEADYINPEAGPADPPGEFKCPQCDPPREFARVQGLSVHMSKIHGVKSGTDEMQQALAV